MGEKVTGKIIQWQVEKSGNSLVVPIPDDFAIELNLKEGDTITVSMNPDKTLELDANSVIPHRDMTHLVDQATAQYQGALDMLAESDK
ncbi:hypothetical protein MUDAN_BIHEEGNE_02574 [Lactiplantibacillus mudanjiangensis]|uniref:AbrB/MazE/SpoVT family DNA-binding domain-containing protein n=1 Tax=Lactiplantibacillus mudanjiangensis TaxID=1296538 RepID=UPI001014FEF9|nr:hypothetical protein MUDAN_BIHEEGNE_02574 [Lactiplantibacillus mudanjiangensis]